MKTGIELIADERKRQIARGYDAAHDDGHDDGSLADLASAVASTDDIVCVINIPQWAADYADRVRDKWGEDRIQCLAIAGALIAAEIERLQRQAARVVTPSRSERK